MWSANRGSSVVFLKIKKKKQSQGRVEPSGCQKRKKSEITVISTLIPSSDSWPSPGGKGAIFPNNWKTKMVRAGSWRCRKRGRKSWLGMVFAFNLPSIPAAAELESKSWPVLESQNALKFIVMQRHHGKEGRDWAGTESPLPNIRIEETTRDLQARSVPSTGCVDQQDIVLHSVFC